MQIRNATCARDEETKLGIQQVHAIEWLQACTR